MGQAGIQPIGPTARFLNLEYSYGTGKLNQLVRLGQLGRWEQLPADLGTIARNVAYADEIRIAGARAPMPKSTARTATTAWVMRGSLDYSSRWRPAAATSVCASSTQPQGRVAPT